MDEPANNPPSQDPAARDQAYERFTALLVTHQPAIKGFIRSLLPRSSDVDDVLQKTCLIAWQKFHQFNETTKFSTWACQIAYFEVKNHLRTKARDKHVFSDEVLELLADEGPRESDRLDEERAALSTCIDKLPANERELLGNCYKPGTTIDAVAERLGRSRNALYKQLNRIRRRLLACITRNLQEGGSA